MKRLVDELPPGFELSLLVSEAIDVPSEASRAAARKAGLAALGVVAGAAGSVAVITSTSAAPPAVPTIAGAGAHVGAAGAGAAKAGVAIAAWKALTLGAVIGGLSVGTGLTVARTSSSAPPAVSSVASGVTPAVARTASETAPASALPSVMPVETTAHEPPSPRNEALQARVAPIVPAGPSKVVSSTISGAPRAEAPQPIGSGSVSSNDLAGEIRALDVVREALGRADPTAALRQLDAYTRAYASGALAPEAKALRVEALAMRGEQGEAQRLARELLAEHPKGPYRKRLERALGGPIR